MQNMCEHFRVRGWFRIPMQIEQINSSDPSRRASVTMRLGSSRSAVSAGMEIDALGISDITLSSAPLLDRPVLVASSGCMSMAVAVTARLYFFAGLPPFDSVFPRLLNV